MAIDGNLEAGQQLDLADPKIFVNGVELAGGLQTQDERLKYYRTKEQVDAPATITFTHEDGDDVFLVFTFNNRTPNSKQLPRPSYLVDEAVVMSGKYDADNPPVLHQNTTSDNTVVKVRAFRVNNSNITSKIVRGELNVVGGNTNG
jgi:hypothetical protein